MDQDTGYIWLPLGWFLIHGAVSNELDAVGGIWAVNKLAAMVSSEDGSAAGKGNMSGEGHDSKRESILMLVTSRLQNLA